MSPRIILSGFFLVAQFLISACFPPVYIYERPTVMEEEASGDYPVINEKLLKKSEASGPLMLSPDVKAEVEAKGKFKNREKEKIYRIIDGEYLAVESKEVKIKEGKE